MVEKMKSVDELNYGSVTKPYINSKGEKIGNKSWCWSNKEIDGVRGVRMMIANSIGEFKSTVNSVLYERRNLFSQRSVNYSAKPLWFLTQDSVDAYENIHADSAHSEERINTPLFCEECGSLHPNHTPDCSQFVLGAFRLNIPSKVNYGNEIGLPGYFGIRYSGKDSEVSTKNIVSGIHSSPPPVNLVSGIARTSTSISNLASHGF